LADEANLAGVEFLKFPDTLARFICPTCRCSTICDTAKDVLKCSGCGRMESTWAMQRLRLPVLRPLNADEILDYEKRMIVWLLRQRADQLESGSDVTDFDRFSVSLY